MAIPQLYNLVRVSTATTGTGTITLGAAVSGFLTFSGASIPDGTTVTYAITDANGNHEVGHGVVGSSGTTLSRVLESSTTGSLINLSGSAQVCVTPSSAGIPQAQGIAARNSSGVWYGRTLTPTTNGGISVTNGDGASGDPTIALGNYLPSGTGAVARSVTGKLGDFISPRDFNAAANGTTDDQTPVADAYAKVQADNRGILLLTGGKYLTSGEIGSNNSVPDTIWSTGPSVMGVYDGTATTPNTLDDRPVLWVQKYSKYDYGNAAAQLVGGVFAEVVAQGSGSPSSKNRGTWNGIIGNAVMEGTNQGTSTSPNYDSNGSAVGVSGFARATGYPGDGMIVTGLWGYPCGPTIDATTWAHLPSGNWGLAGVEINIQQNSPDVGEQPLFIGQGCTVGFLANNYRAPGAGVIDWTFAMVLGGYPNDGNFASTNMDNWNGFHNGILLNYIKQKGIRFGQYMKTGSYGIWFPDSYIGTNEPAAAIYLGNSKINMGQYVGSTWNSNDLGHNGGRLYFNVSGTNYELLKIDPVGNITTGAGSYFFFETAAGSINFAIANVASCVNYLTAVGAATTGAPYLAAFGSDTNIDIQLIPKGTGKVLIGPWTTSSDAAVNGYITVKDSTGNLRKIATIA
jgi:hypothetical protein